MFVFLFSVMATVVRVTRRRAVIRGDPNLMTNFVITIIQHDALPPYHGLTLQLPTLNISINLISNYGVVFLTLYLVGAYVKVIMKGGVGKNGSTVAVRVVQKLISIVPFKLTPCYNTIARELITHLSELATAALYQRSLKTPSGSLVLRGFYIRVSSCSVELCHYTHLLRKTRLLPSNQLGVGTIGLVK